MKNKPKITYLLGAGASANAVPTIKFFPILLQFFKNEIENKLKTAELNEFDAQTAIEKLKIITEIGNFATVDTWARKLYLSDDSKYEVLKEVLSLFLVYCQFGSNSQLGQYLSDNGFLAKSGIYNLTDTDKYQFERMYQSTLDPRYDLFLGSILHQDNESRKIQFPENINIVSWNYDSQFETSLRTFTKSNINRKDGSEFSIYKLNGSANFLMQERKSIENAFNFYYEKEKNINYMDRIIIILSNSSAPFKSFKNNLKFAWEMQSDISSVVTSIIANTDILVVIGYTFPSFNQEVEREIFRRNSKIQKVYYQIPESEYESLLERLKMTVFQGSEDPHFINGFGNLIRVKFTNIKDMNQFYIPNEFYM